MNELGTMLNPSTMLSRRKWTDKEFATARVRARAALLEALPGTDDVVRSKYARLVDMTAFDFSRAQPEKYMRVMFRVTSNLRTNGSALVASLGPAAIVRASHTRLSAGTLQAQRDAALEARIKNLLSRAEVEAGAVTQRAAAIKLTQQPRCPKCKRTENIARVTAALRRGDEGMVTQCICANEGCGYKWNLAS